MVRQFCIRCGKYKNWNEFEMDDKEGMSSYCFACREELKLKTKNNGENITQEK